MLPTIHSFRRNHGGALLCNALALSTDERQRYGELAKT